MTGRRTSGSQPAAEAVAYSRMSFLSASVYLASTTFTAPACRITLLVAVIIVVIIIIAVVIIIILIVITI